MILSFRDKADARAHGTERFKVLAGSIIAAIALFKQYPFESLSAIITSVSLYTGFSFIKGFRKK